MVWSKVKGCYVVVSELAKQNGKNKYGQTGETTGLLSALLCALMLTGSALFWPMEVSAGTQYGDGTWADGYNTAIGIAATARGDGALALGTQTKATSIRSTAIGHQAEASGADSISIGTLSGASNTHSIAIGDKARAYGIDAIAFGASANATATNSMAVGRNARSTAGGSVAVGINTEVTQINSVAMGATAKAYGDSAVSLGVDVVSRGHSAVAVGANADALAQSAVSIGDSTLANAHNAVSVGISSQATAERAIAMGDSTRATAWDGVAIGTAAKANATGAVAIGKDALANQEAGTAVGIGAEATGQYAAAFGDVAKASVRWGTAIGTGSLANVAAGAVGYDPSGAFHSGDTTGTWKSTLGAVAVGDTTRNKTRQIIGVAAGTNDTDAVNVAQLKAAQLGGGGDSSWVIQDTNSPQGRKTIDKNNPLTVRGDRYIKAEVGYDGLNLKLDENQLNNSISNNSTVQNNRTDINNLKSGFNLKAGSATSQVRLGEGTTPTIEFATADDTMTVNLSDKKVTYGIDKNKLVKNITGDLITNINNSTTTPITNIKAQFGVTADSGSQKTVTLTKDTTPTVKFKGDGKYLTSVTDTDGVQYSVDENKLNQNITNITNEAIKGKGLYFGANSGATVLNKLGSTVKIQGEGTKADSEYSGENIKTKVSQDASGNTNINMMLASALNGITSISNGKAGSNNTTITLGDGTVNVGGSTISNVKSALNGTALANASEDQKKSAATIGDLKDAVNNMSGDVNWVIQDANTPKGTKTINSTTPLTVKGDKYVKTTVNNDGLSLGLDEDQLNNTITNNNTVQNNKTDISNLKAGFNLKAGATTSQVKLGEATTPTIEFATADDTMTVNLSDKKVTYGIDKNKLINNINNTTNNPVTNIKAQFGVTADSGSQKTVTLTKDTTPTVKFKGDGKYLTSVTDTDGVQYSVDENKLNQNITNITNEAIKGKGLYFGANSGATVLNKLGSTVKIQGEGTKADSEYSGKNVKTKVSQDASGNTIIDVMLDKELSADKVIVGKAGADGKDGVIGVNGKDGVSGVGINGKDGISVKGDKGEVGINGNDGISIKGKDGKDAVTINGKDGVPGVDGKEGHIGLNGKDGITDIWTRPGQPGLNGANGTTMTRVVYKDPKGNEHEVATLDDGLKFAGDDGQTDKSKVIAKLLNKTMDIVGGADNTKLTDGNIGVNNVNGKLQVQLASALNGITSISNGKAGSNNTTITLGDGTVNVGGSTISNVKSALNGTALANASEDQKKSAATIGDLQEVNKTVSGKGLYFGANSGATVLNKLESTVKIQGEGTKADSEYSGQNVKTKISQDANGNTVIDLMLAKKAVFDSVTTGNTIIDNRGLTVGGTTYVSDSGLNAGGKKITNVADGTDPHDAVNVSQLNKVVAGATTKVADGKNTTVTSETNANGSKTYHVNLNDDITLGTDPSKQISIKGTEGTIKAGKVTVDGSKGTVNGLTNLTWDPNHFTSGQAATEDQLKAVAGQITKAAKQSSVSAGKNITVTKGTNADGGVDYKVATADDLNLNSVTTGKTVINDKGLTVGGTTYVSKDGLNAGGKKIINVAPGEISKNSTDAVNGGQLYQTNEALNKIGGAINNMDNRINRVGAGAAALAALHPLDFDPDSKWDFAAGYGNYKGANAVAVGAYYRPNEDTMISVGGSMGGGQNMINAGVSLKIGRGNHVSTSRVAMAKEIKDLRAELENMKGALMKVSEGRPLDSLDMDKMQLFPDVPANHWAYDYVATLAGNGVIVGYPDGQFGGDRMMTRYEMAALIYRAMQNGAAADDRMARALKEFEPELERIRVDTITKHKDGTPDIQRVRVIKGRG